MKTKITLILILLWGCTGATEPQAPVVPPKLYFTMSPYLREIQLAGVYGYYAMAAGVVTNKTGLPVREIKPELRLYFTRADFDLDRPALTAFGEMGTIKDPFDIALGLVNVKTVIQPEETLDHWTRTEGFLLPKNFAGIWYRVSFGQPFAVRSGKMEIKSRGVSLGSGIYDLCSPLEFMAT